MVNAGVIAGTSGDGVSLSAGGNVTNQSGGTISGSHGITANMGALTVVNAGAIAGSRYALHFTAGYANRLIADPSAVFEGNIYGGGGVLELASAADAGTLSGFGTTIINFGSLQFDSGVAWTIAGNDSAGGLSTIAISGFTNGDTIDLTGFIEASDTIVNTNTLVLTDSAGDQATLNIEGGFTAGSFQFSNDGHGGTDVVVCFAAGTLIDTQSGEVQVEKLNVGDLVMTAHNGPLPVRWIGKGKVLATPDRRTAATPVVVRKGALGPNMPH